MPFRTRRCSLFCLLAIVASGAIARGDDDASIATSDKITARRRATD